MFQQPLRGRISVDLFVKELLRLFPKSGQAEGEPAFFMRRGNGDYGRGMEAVRELRVHEPPKNNYGLKGLKPFEAIYVS